MQQLYSVEQVAERLGLHVRTVRNYVRDGRLKATRIGKQYRIAREDLEAFAGRAVSGPRRGRRAEVSSIVQIDGVDPDLMYRLSTALTAVPGSPGDERRHVTTHYDEEHESMKIIMVGGIKANTHLLTLIDALLQAER